MGQNTLQLLSYFDEDYQNYQKIKLNKETIWSKSDLAMDCPEDATLNRDMTSGMEILDIIKKTNKLQIEYLESVECENFVEWEDA